MLKVGDFAGYQVLEDSRFHDEKWWFCLKDYEDEKACTRAAKNCYDEIFGYMCDSWYSHGYSDYSRFGNWMRVILRKLTVKELNEDGSVKVYSCEIVEENCLED